MVLLNNFPINFSRLFEEHGMLIKVEKGSHLFHAGETALEFFLIKSGKIQISKDTENGKELTLRICGNNKIIGESTLFSEMTLHSTTAKALELSNILVLSKNSLELTLSEQPALMIEYLKWCQIENIKTQTLIRDLLLHGKKGALYSTLIRLSNTFGKLQDDGSYRIDLHLTNTEIANLCGTSRELINRMLSDLKKQNIITYDKSFITILNLEYLKTEICCENCPRKICRIG